MALFKSQHLFTVDEYLERERNSQERHEYVDGQITAMAGESLEHGDITVNLVMLLGSRLKGTGCRALTKDTKVRSGPSPKAGQNTNGLYCYPDIVVICGQPQYHDEHRDVVLNPAVILEVLSPSTETFDRGEKFRRYQMWNRSLKDYLLVSQTRPVIELYTRQADRGWSYSLTEGLEEFLTISSINCTVKLADVFDRVDFSHLTD